MTRRKWASFVVMTSIVVATVVTYIAPDGSGNNLPVASPELDVKTSDDVTRPVIPIGDDIIYMNDRPYLLRGSYVIEITDKKDKNEIPNASSSLDCSVRECPTSPR